MTKPAEEKRNRERNIKYKAAPLGLLANYYLTFSHKKSVLTFKEAQLYRVLPYDLSRPAHHNIS
jgi:hypothetical protein